MPNRATDHTSDIAAQYQSSYLLSLQHPIFMHKSFLLLSFICFQFSAVFSQIYPALTGQALLDQLVFDFKPSTVLGYDEARDTLYGRIYLTEGSVTCVYSGFSLSLPPGEDPSTFLFMNGSADGINCEHTFPRSKGADIGNPKSDMHHLYPTRAGVNTARGNDPYAEIPDQQTIKWYRLDEELTTIPPTMIEEYSERGNGSFEPREDHKGNVARAMFYFYTMYREQADDADPDFFDLQRETLCQWHYTDPVDSLEHARSLMIASYQDGLANPFVLDCTTATRSYCSDAPQPCTPLVPASESTLQVRTASLSIFPQPANRFFYLEYDHGTFSDIQVSIISMDGTLLYQTPWVPGSAVDCSGLPVGIYFVFLQFSEGVSEPAKLMIVR
jgi:hypothetical protein